MAYEVPPLPYDYNALEPHIDEATMRVHHDKHHQAYVDKANAALEGTEWADKPVEEVLKNLGALPSDKQGPVRNNAGGHYNHSLFWEWMSPSGGGAPDGALASASAGGWRSVGRKYWDRRVIGREAYALGLVSLLTGAATDDLLATPRAMQDSERDRAPAVRADRDVALVLSALDRCVGGRRRLPLVVADSRLWHGPCRGGPAPPPRLRDLVLDCEDHHHRDDQPDHSEEDDDLHASSGLPHARAQIHSSPASWI